MALRKDIKKNTDLLRGKPSKSEVKEVRKSKVRSEVKAREKDPSRKEKAEGRSMGSGVASKVKEKVKEAKKVLPGKKVVEDRDEFIERQRGMSGGPKSREQYVEAKKKSGKTVKPRTELSKGWGKKAPVKARKMDE
jgi:hypothetical protein